MKTFLVTAFLALFYASVSTQTASCTIENKRRGKIKKLLKLPPAVSESSGIIVWNGDFYTHNDSGGEPVIYRIDSASGEVLSIITLTNAVNRDWEDIAQDKDYIYVGDFGNNSGKRKDLRIYKIAKKDVTPEDCNVKAGIIAFSYLDQTNFDVESYNHDFDCEAMTVYGDSLLLFTKNWKNLKTRLYKLPVKEGDYNVSALQECDVEGLITGASYNPDLNTLILSGYKKYKPFLIANRNFTGLLDTNAVKIKVRGKRFTQTEGIYLSGDSSVFISSEKTKLRKGRIYRLKTGKILYQ